MKGNRWVVLMMCILVPTLLDAQQSAKKNNYTRADTLRGSITKYRQGWNVLKYELGVNVDISNKRISGNNTITYFESEPVRTMQIDLQKPMVIDSVINDAGYPVAFENAGNAWLVKLKPEGAMIKFLPGIRSLRVYYQGTPVEPVRPPWDGGVIWKQDSTGNPLVATACQGDGASLWWPCKDHQSDEPDSGMIVTITVPDTLVAISNGRLVATAKTNGRRSFIWQVKSPINTYDVTMNIGKYASWNESFYGEGGKLDLEFWALQEDVEKAKKQFVQVKPMLQCFEHWFGKYPFYEDGYKLVQTPFLGMEHQSAVAYGNKFMNGYLGRDRSKTGYGLLWDFIIIHESGHEWFGNNITAADIADMWLHEGFTTYSEVLYTGCQSGKQAGYAYMYGIQQSILNDKPVIGDYGVNKEGSSDMYVKGAALIHTIRNIINDDEKFRHLLRKMNQQYYQQVVTSNEIEAFIIKETGLPLKPLFHQYLRTTTIPVLEYIIDKKHSRINYRITNAVSNFKIDVLLPEQSNVKLSCSSRWNSLRLNKQQLAAITPSAIEKRYLLNVKDITPKQ